MWCACVGCSGVGGHEWLPRCSWQPLPTSLMQTAVTAGMSALLVGAFWGRGVHRRQHILWRITFLWDTRQARAVGLRHSKGLGWPSSLQWYLRCPRERPGQWHSSSWAVLSQLSCLKLYPEGHSSHQCWVVTQAAASELSVSACPSARDRDPLCHPAQNSSTSQQLLVCGWRRLVTEYSECRIQIWSFGRSEHCSERKGSHDQFIDAFWSGSHTNAFCGGTVSLKELSSKTSHIWCSGQIPVALVPCWNECVVQVQAVIPDWQPDEAAAPHQLSLAQSCPQQCLWEASCDTAGDLSGWEVTRAWLAPLFSASSITWEIPEPCH